MVFGINLARKARGQCLSLNLDFEKRFVSFGFVIRVCVVRQHMVFLHHILSIFINYKIDKFIRRFYVDGKISISTTLNFILSMSLWESQAFRKIH